MKIWWESAQRLVRTSISFFIPLDMDQGRLMHIFGKWRLNLSFILTNLVRQRFYNFYGQISARLDCDHSVHGHSAIQRSALVSLLSPLLFYAPDVYLRTLQKIWVDHLVHIASWITFMDKLNSEWQDLNLLVCGFKFRIAFSFLIQLGNCAFSCKCLVPWHSERRFD